MNYRCGYVEKSLIIQHPLLLFPFFLLRRLWIDIELSPSLFFLTFLIPTSSRVVPLFIPTQIFLIPTLIPNSLLEQCANLFDLLHEE